MNLEKSKDIYDGLQLGNVIIVFGIELSDGTSENTAHPNESGTSITAASRSELPINIRASKQDIYEISRT